MKNTFVFDACALVAFLQNEPGSDIVSDVLYEATNGCAEVYMHKLNLLEVYYDIFRRFDEAEADNVMSAITESEIKIIPDISDAVLKIAGRYKASYRLSLADAIALAETSVRSATIVTSDHHELEEIEKNEQIKFLWIR